MKPPLFFTDTAITKGIQDRLGRKAFAKQLAQRLAVWNSEDSLVVGLYGPWGSGKSSVKNMALEYLRRDSASCPTIVEFNPWQVSGQEQLTEFFFHEIAIALHNVAGGDPKGEERADKWANYGTLCSVGSKVAASLNTILPFVGIPGGPLFGMAAKTLASTGELAAQGEKAAKGRTKTLQEAKEELRKSFKEYLTKPVLVVIDDIDRLTSEEIRLLFRVVKANADFPRFIFLLLFQKYNVEKALDEVSDGHGPAYLEKIVQVGFDVPELNRSSLHAALAEGVNDILENSANVSKFQQERWLNAFIPNLQPYFKSLRDVYRFLNVFSFSVSSLSCDNVLEVNAVDLICTEVLRVFENETFRRIAASKDLLTKHHNSDHTQRKEIRDAIESLAADARSKKRVLDLVGQLFPNLGGVLGNTNYGRDWSPQWRSELRICHPAVFDRYFFLTVPDDDISQREILAFVADVDDRAKLVAHLKSFQRRGLLQSAFERMEGEKGLTACADPLPLLTAICDISDNLGSMSLGMGTLPLSTFIVWRTNAILETVEDPNKRCAILTTTIRESTGLLGPVRLASSQERLKKPEQQQKKYLVDEPCAAELAKIAAGKIRDAAKTGVLLTNEDLSFLLSCWQKWADPQEAKNWAQEILEHEANVAPFLAGFAWKGSSQTVGSYYQRRQTHVSLSAVEAVADIQLVARAVKKLSKRKFSADEKSAIAAFNRSLERRRKGLREEPPFDDASDDD